MTAFENVQTGALVHVLDKNDELVAKMPDFILRTLEEMDTSQQFRVNERIDELVTTVGAQNLATDFAGLQSGNPQIAYFIDVRSRPWYVNGAGGTSLMDWLPVDDSQRPRTYSDAATEKGPPKYIEVIYTDRTIAGTSGIDLRVWPIPDGLATAGVFSSDGEYRIQIPYWRRLPKGSITTQENWFLNACAEYVELRSAAKGCFFNRDRDEALVLEARAKDELRRLKRIEKVSKLGTLTLRPASGSRTITTRHR